MEKELVLALLLYALTKNDSEDEEPTDPRDMIRPNAKQALSFYNKINDIDDESELVGTALEFFLNHAPVPDFFKKFLRAFQDFLNDDEKQDYKEFMPFNLDGTPEYNILRIFMTKIIKLKYLIAPYLTRLRLAIKRPNEMVTDLSTKLDPIRDVFALITVADKDLEAVVEYCVTVMCPACLVPCSKNVCVDKISANCGDRAVVKYIISPRYLNYMKSPFIHVAVSKGNFTYGQKRGDLYVQVLFNVGTSIFAEPVVDADQFKKLTNIDEFMVFANNRELETKTYDNIFDKTEVENYIKSLYPIQYNCSLLDTGCLFALRKFIANNPDQTAFVEHFLATFYKTSSAVYSLDAGPGKGKTAIIVRLLCSILGVTIKRNGNDVRVDIEKARYSVYTRMGANRLLPLVLIQSKTNASSLMKIFGLNYGEYLGMFNTSIRQDDDDSTKLPLAEYLLLLMLKAKTANVPPIMVVDETSILHPGCIALLLFLPLFHPVKLIFVGDRNQQSSIQTIAHHRGSNYGILEKCGISSHTLSQTMRQTDEKSHQIINKIKSFYMDLLEPQKAMSIDITFTYFHLMAIVRIYPNLVTPKRIHQLRGSKRAFKFFENYFGLFLASQHHYLFLRQVRTVKFLKNLQIPFDFLPFFIPETIKDPNSKLIPLDQLSLEKNGLRGSPDTMRRKYGNQIERYIELESRKIMPRAADFKFSLHLILCRRFLYLYTEKNGTKHFCELLDYNIDKNDYAASTVCVRLLDSNEEKTLKIERIDWSKINSTFSQHARKILSFGEYGDTRLYYNLYTFPIINAIQTYASIQGIELTNFPQNSVDFQIPNYVQEAYVGISRTTNLDQLGSFVVACDHQKWVRNVKFNLHSTSQDVFFLNQQTLEKYESEGKHADEVIASIDWVESRKDDYYKQTRHTTYENTRYRFETYSKNFTNEHRANQKDADASIFQSHVSTIYKNFASYHHIFDATAYDTYRKRLEAFTKVHDQMMAKKEPISFNLK